MITQSAPPVDQLKRQRDSFFKTYASITDRQEQYQALKHLSENEAAFYGQTPEQVGQTMNQLLGAYAKENAAELAQRGAGEYDENEFVNLYGQNFGNAGGGYDKFNSPLRNLHAAGYLFKTNINESFIGDAVEGAVGGLTSMFTDDQEQIESWENMGRQLPGGLATMLIGAVPGGMVPMAGLMYGGGVDEATSRGYGGAKAVTAGMIDAATNVAVLKVAGPLANKSTDALLKWTGKAEALSTLAASKAGTALLTAGAKEGLLSKGSAMAIRAGAEFATNLAQTGIGVAGELAREGVLDMDGMVSMLYDPTYWAQTIVAESVMGVAGSAASHVRYARKMRKLETEEAGTSTTFIPAAQVDPAVAAAQAANAAKAGGPPPPTPPAGPSRIGTAPPTTPPPAGGAAATPPVAGGSKVTNTVVTASGRKLDVYDNGSSYDNDKAKKRNVTTGFVDEATGAAVEKVIASMEKGAPYAIIINRKKGRLQVKLQDRTTSNWKVVKEFPLSTTPTVGARVVEGRKQHNEGFYDFSVSEVVQSVDELPPTVPLYTDTPEGGSDGKVVNDNKAQIEGSAKEVAKAAKKARAPKKSADPAKPVDPGIAPIAAGPIETKMNAATVLESEGNSPLHHPPTDVAAAVVAEGPDAVNRLFAQTVTVFDGLENLNVERDSLTNTFTIQREDGTAINVPMLDLVDIDPAAFAARHASPEAQQLHAQYHGFFDRAMSSDTTLFESRNFTRNQQIAMKDFMESSGLNEVLLKNNARIVFTDAESGRNLFTQTDVKGPVATALQREGQMIYIIRGARKGRSTDVHELGHVVHDMLSRGFYGDKAKAEFDALLANASKIKLDNSLAVKLAKQVGDAEGLNEGLASYQRHLTDIDEIAAQMFKGFALQQKSPFVKYFAENYPTLYKLFTNIVDAFRNSKDYVKGDKSARQTFLETRFNPGQREANAFFASLFKDRAYTQRREMAIRELVRKKGFDPEVADTLYEVVGNSHSTFNEVLALELADQFDAGEGSKEALLTALRAVNSFKGTLLTGADVPKGKMSKAQIKNFATDHFTMPHTVNLEKLARRGNTQAQRALEAVQIVLTDKIKRVERVIEDGDVRALTLMLVKNIQTDTIVGRWMRGDLPGQERPMHDAMSDQVLPMFTRLGTDMAKRKYSGVEVLPDGTVKDASDVAAESDINNKNYEYERTTEAMDRRAGEARRFFPILTKALKDNVRLSEATNDAWVNVGDEVAFGKKNARGTRLVFSADEKARAEGHADMLNKSDKFFGVEFTVTPKHPEGNKVKKRKDGTIIERKGPQEYYIRARQSELKRSVVDYEALFESEAFVDHHLASMELEPKLAARINELQQMARAEMPDGGRPMEFVTSTLSKIFREISQSKENARLKTDEGLLTVSGKFQKHLKEIGTWRDTENGNAEWEAMVQEINMVRENNTPPVGPDRYISVMMELLKLSENSPEVFKGIAMNAHDYVSKALQSFSNLAYNVLEVQRQVEIQNVNDGAPVTYDFKSARALQKVLGKTSPLDGGAIKGFAPINAASDTGPAAKIASGVSYSKPRSYMGKAVAALEALHFKTFGNEIQTAETSPEWEPVRRSLVDEPGNINMIGTSASEMHHWSGKLVQRPDGDYDFVRDPQGGIDNKAYMTVMSNLDLKMMFNNASLVGNHHGLTFKRLLELHPNDPLRAESDVKEFFDHYNDYFKGFQKPTDVAKLDALTELMYRNYEAVLDVNRSSIRMERQSLEAHTALSMYKGSTRTDITARDAENVASLLSQHMPDPNGIPSQARIDIIKNFTGWDDERAHGFDAAWVKSQNAITKLGVLYEDTRYYVTEKRFKKFVVTYGITRGPDKGRTGARDFETNDEALKFMQEGKAQGFVFKQRAPKNQEDFKGAFKVLTSKIDEAVDHVVGGREVLMDFTVDTLKQQGRLTDADASKFKGLITPIREELKLELMAGATDVDTKMQRMFKPGREHLDAMFQTSKYIWAKATASSQRLTDARYALYLEDPVLRSQRNESKMKRFVNAKAALRTRDGDLQRGVQKAAFTMFMGANISTALIEAAQYPISLSHILIENGGGFLASFTMPGKVAARAAAAAAQRLQSGSDASIWSKIEADLIRRAETAGRLNVRNYMDINDDAVRQQMEMFKHIADPGSGSLSELKPSTLVNAAITSMTKFYGFWNRINAETSLVAAYETLKESKYGKKEPTAAQREELFSRAMDVADMANGSHGRAGRPRWFHTQDGGMRTAAQLAWSLQSYASNYIANWLRLMKKSIAGGEYGFSQTDVKNAQKALAAMTGVQLAAFGMIGIPLAGGIAKIASTLFGYDPETALLEFLDDETELSEADVVSMSDMVVYGLQRASGLPVDLRGRIAVSGMGPISQFEGFNAAAFGGPLLNMAGTFIAGNHEVRKGNVEPGRYLVNAAPVGLQRALRMMLFDEGDVLTKGGKHVMAPSGEETAAMFAGFTPTRYMDHIKTSVKLREAQMRDADERSAAANRLARMLSQNDPSVRQHLHDEARKLKLEPEDLATRATEKLMEKIFPSAANVGTGPNTQRAARLYKDPIVQPPTQTRVATKLLMLEKLGMPAQNAVKQMNDAKMVDVLRRQTGFSEQEVKRRMRRSTQGTPMQDVLSQPQTGLGGLF